MKNFEALKVEAMALYEHVKTIWDNYDFDEKSSVIDRRVPKLKFLVEVEHMCEEVIHIEGLNERYIRECQVKYNNNVYIFEIYTRISSKKVVGYYLEVYTPAGDGVGGKHFLFKERL